MPFSINKHAFLLLSQPAIRGAISASTLCVCGGKMARSPLAPGSAALLSVAEARPLPQKLFSSARCTYGSLRKCVLWKGSGYLRLPSIRG